MENTALLYHSLHAGQYLLRPWRLCKTSLRALQAQLSAFHHRNPRTLSDPDRQPATEHWHDYIGEAILADAVLDRPLAHRLELRGESMRKLTAGLTDRDRSA